MVLTESVIITTYLVDLDNHVVAELQHVLREVILLPDGLLHHREQILTDAQLNKPTP